MSVVYIQGNDYKAQSWARHFSCNVKTFSKAVDYVSVIKNVKRLDSVVFRYQNDHPKLSLTLVMLLLVFFTILVCKLVGARVFWICHNVDRETLNHWYFITKARRFLLIKLSNEIFVLHKNFVTFAKFPVKVISFGEKNNGSISKENLFYIKEFVRDYDCRILIAGDGNSKKNLSFSRVEELFTEAKKLSLSCCFVLAGVYDLNSVPKYLRKHCILLNEKNLNEKALTKYIDCIYKENSDVSLGYTIFSAVSAQIPILTKKGNVLENILLSEGIGCTTGDFKNIVINTDKWRFDKFLSKYRWDSLAQAIEGKKKQDE